MKKKIIFFCFFILILILGPKVEKPIIFKDLPEINLSINELKSWINQKESKFKNIKEGNESRIIFYDSVPKKTNISIVYLHGFSGSSQDGFPVHRNIAKKLNSNIYLPRLYAHGLNSDEPLIEYTGEKYLDSAREALAIGKIIGEKVILMCTSTGCSAALALAANHPEVAALVMYAPNIRITHPLDFVATLPWGLYIVRLVEGGKYHYITNTWKDKEKFWTTKYRLEAPIEMQNLLETAMNEDVFIKVKVPTFSGFYYKNEIEQDNVVSVDAMRMMFKELGTEDSLKLEIAFEDAGGHEIAYNVVNKNYVKVQESTLIFLQNVFNLNED
tara:strand:- start:499 stop:1485 length:987 start_codon:yes stop_codon:yes gene_type:complete